MKSKAINNALAAFHRGEVSYLMESELKETPHIAASFYHTGYVNFKLITALFGTCTISKIFFLHLGQCCPYGRRTENINIFPLTLTSTLILNVTPTLNHKNIFEKTE